MRTVGVSTRNDVASPAQGPAWGAHGLAFEAHLVPQAVSTSVPAGGMVQARSIGLPILFESGEDRAARRRKAVQRGTGMIALLGLLRDADLGDEAVPADVLDQLASSIAEDWPAEGDELGTVLQEIATRVHVELARRGR